MNKLARFSELASGMCFDYQGRVYRKLRMNLAEGEKRVRALFPSDLEVAMVEMQWRGAQHAEGKQVCAEVRQVIRLSTVVKSTPVGVPAPTDPRGGRKLTA